MPGTLLGAVDLGVKKPGQVPERDKMTKTIRCKFRDDVLLKPHRRVRGWGNRGEAMKLLLRGQSPGADLSRGREEGSLVDIWGKSIPGRGHSRCKGPEAGRGLRDSCCQSRGKAGPRLCLLSLTGTMEPASQA